jgi:hypothetical protein
LGQDNCGVLVGTAMEEERRMSSTLQEGLTPRDSLLEVEYDV